MPLSAHQTAKNRHRSLAKHRAGDYTTHRRRNDDMSFQDKAGIAQLAEQLICNQ